jgi:hypothetical protein
MPVAISRGSSVPLGSFLDRHKTQLKSNQMDLKVSVVQVDWVKILVLMEDLRLQAMFLWAEVSRIEKNY